MIFAITPAEWMYNPIGSVHGGVAATLLDSSLGCAIHTMLAAGPRYTTTDLHVRYVRAMSADTGRVLADCARRPRRPQAGDRRGPAVRRGGGKLFATRTTSCLILCRSVSARPRRGDRD